MSRGWFSFPTDVYPVTFWLSGFGLQSSSLVFGQVRWFSCGYLGLQWQIGPTESRGTGLGVEYRTETRCRELWTGKLSLERRPNHRTGWVKEVPWGFEWKLIVDSAARVNETARRSRIEKCRKYFLGFPYFLRDRERTASRRRRHWAFLLVEVPA